MPIDVNANAGEAGDSVGASAGDGVADGSNSYSNAPNINCPVDAGDIDIDGFVVFPEFAICPETGLLKFIPDSSTAISIASTGDVKLTVIVSFPEPLFIA